MCEKLLFTRLGVIIVATILFFTSWVWGMLCFHWVYGLDWYWSIYAAANILSGMGPVAPPPNDGARIFLAIYSLYCNVLNGLLVAVLVCPWVLWLFDRLSLSPHHLPTRRRSQSPSRSSSLPEYTLPSPSPSPLPLPLSSTPEALPALSGDYDVSEFHCGADTVAPELPDRRSSSSNSSAFTASESMANLERLPSSTGSWLAYLLRQSFVVCLGLAIIALDMVATTAHYYFVARFNVTDAANNAAALVGNLGPIDLLTDDRAILATSGFVFLSSTLQYLAVVTMLVPLLGFLVERLYNKFEHNKHHRADRIALISG